MGDKDKLLTDRIKLQMYKQQYARFSREAGLRTEAERLHVAGFGRSQGASFVAAVNEQTAIIDSFKQGMADAGYTVKGFDYYDGDAETLNQMQTAFARMAKEFPDEAKGLTVRLSRTKSKENFGWYDNTKRAIHYNQDLFKNWSTTQKEYASLVKSGHFPAGTDARGCFYHEFGHAVGYARGINYKKVTTETMVSIGRGFGNPPHISAKAAAELLPSVLSKYTTDWTNRQFEEVIAECFSEWYSSEQPREFCKEFLRRAGVF